MIHPFMTEGALNGSPLDSRASPPSHQRGFYDDALSASIMPSASPGTSRGDNSVMDNSIAELAEDAKAPPKRHTTAMHGSGGKVMAGTIGENYENTDSAAIQLKTSTQYVNAQSVNNDALLASQNVFANTNNAAQNNMQLQFRNGLRLLPQATTKIHFKTFPGPKLRQTGNTTEIRREAVSPQPPQLTQRIFTTQPIPNSIAMSYRSPRPTKVQSIRNNVTGNQFNSVATNYPRPISVRGNVTGNSNSAGENTTTAKPISIITSDVVTNNAAPQNLQSSPKATSEAPTVTPVKRNSGKIPKGQRKNEQFLQVKLGSPVEVSTEEENSSTREFSENVSENCDKTSQFSKASKNSHSLNENSTSVHVEATSTLNMSKITEITARPENNSSATARTIQSACTVLEESNIIEKRKIEAVKKFESQGLQDSPVDKLISKHEKVINSQKKSPYRTKALSGNYKRNSGSAGVKSTPVNLEKRKSVEKKYEEMTASEKKIDRIANIGLLKRTSEAESETAGSEARKSEITRSEVNDKNSETLVPVETPVESADNTSTENITQNEISQIKGSPAVSVIPPPSTTSICSKESHFLLQPSEVVSHGKITPKDGFENNSVNKSGLSSIQEMASNPSIPQATPISNTSQISVPNHCKTHSAYFGRSIDEMSERSYPSGRYNNNVTPVSTVGISPGVVSLKSGVYMTRGNSLGQPRNYANAMQMRQRSLQKDNKNGTITELKSAERMPSSFADNVSRFRNQSAGGRITPLLVQNPFSRTAGGSQFNYYSNSNTPMSMIGHFQPTPVSVVGKGSLGSKSANESDGNNNSSLNESGEKDTARKVSDVSSTQSPSTSQKQFVRAKPTGSPLGPRKSKDSIVLRVIRMT